MNLRVITVFLIGIIYMILASIFLPFIYLFRMLNWQNIANFTVTRITLFWSRFTLFLNGVRHNVQGLENLPKHNNICFVSNHQSNFDIPIILGNIPKVIGFISKIELARIPMLNLWMFVIRCPFIDRKNREKSLEIINHRIKKINNGQPMLIFPEGTRSRKQEMNSFKKGGILSIIHADVTIVPLTVCNSYKIDSDTNTKLSKIMSNLIIHKPYKPSERGKTDEEVIQELENIIRPSNQHGKCDE